MLGYIEYDENTKVVRLEQRRVMGGMFLTLTFGRENRGMAGRWKVIRAAKKMREAGVRQAVFPVDFPYTSEFLRQGVVLVDTLPLRRAVCPHYVRTRLKELQIPPERGIIALSGEYLNRELRGITENLALDFRYVMLSVPEGGEELGHELRRTYGISLILKPTRDQLERSDALILFAPRTDLSCVNKVLCAVYPGGEFTRGRVPISLGGEMVRNLPPNCDREQFAAALYAMGMLEKSGVFDEIKG